MERTNTDNSSYGAGTSFDADFGASASASARNVRGVLVTDTIFANLANSSSNEQLNKSRFKFFSSATVVKQDPGFPATVVKRPHIKQKTNVNKDIEYMQCQHDYCNQLIYASMTNMKQGKDCKEQIIALKKLETEVTKQLRLYSRYDNRHIPQEQKNLLITSAQVLLNNIVDFLTKQHKPISNSSNTRAQQNIATTNNTKIKEKNFICINALLDLVETDINQCYRQVKKINSDIEKGDINNKEKLATIKSSIPKIKENLDTAAQHFYMLLDEYPDGKEKILSEKIEELDKMIKNF